MHNFTARDSSQCEPRPNALSSQLQSGWMNASIKVSTANNPTQETSSPSAAAIDKGAERNFAALGAACHSCDKLQCFAT
jgi:hypothetical protein